MSNDIRLHKIAPLGHLKYRASDHPHPTGQNGHNPIFFFKIVKNLYCLVCIFESGFQISHLLNSKFYLESFGCYHILILHAIHLPPLLSSSLGKGQSPFLYGFMSMCWKKIDMACPRLYSVIGQIYSSSLVSEVRHCLTSEGVFSRELLVNILYLVLLSLTQYSASLLSESDVWFTLFMMKYCSIFLVFRMFGLLWTVLELNNISSAFTG